MATYKSLLKQLVDESGPDAGTLTVMTERAKAYLELLAKDTNTIVFKDHSVVFNLISAYFVEKYGRDVTAITLGKPADITKMIAHCTIGETPGIFEIVITRRPRDMVAIHYTRVETGNLREAPARGEVDA